MTFFFFLETAVCVSLYLWHGNSSSHQFSLIHGWLQKILDVHCEETQYQHVHYLHIQFSQNSDIKVQSMKPHWTKNLNIRLDPAVALKVIDRHQLKLHVKCLNYMKTLLTILLFVNIGSNFILNDKHKNPFQADDVRVLIEPSCLHDIEIWAVIFHLYCVIITCY